MIACVGRVLRLSLAVAFVSMLGLAATNASAQFGFIDESDVCSDPNSVVSDFDDAEKWSAFSGVSNCNKICNSYTNKCKAFVKNAASCINKTINDNQEIDKKAICDTLPDKSDRKECKNDVDAEAKADKEDLKADKSSALTACEDLQADCVSFCEDPLVL